MPVLYRRKNTWQKLKDRVLRRNLFYGLIMSYPKINADELQAIERDLEAIAAPHEHKPGWVVSLKTVLFDAHLTYGVRFHAKRTRENEQEFIHLQKVIDRFTSVFVGGDVQNHEQKKETPHKPFGRQLLADISVSVPSRDELKDLTAIRDEIKTLIHDAADKMPPGWLLDAEQTITSNYYTLVFQLFATKEQPQDEFVDQIAERLSRIKTHGDELFAKHKNARQPAPGQYDRYQHPHPDEVS